MKLAVCTNTRSSISRARLTCHHLGLLHSPPKIRQLPRRHSMATPAAVTAVIRAYKPAFRTDHDKLAFAVHSVLCVAGCRLLAVGAEAESTDPAVRFRSDEADVTGWDASASPEQGGHYAFMYAPPTTTPASTAEQASKQVLLVKAVAMGDQLLVSLVVDPSPAGQSPDTLELQVDKFCGGDKVGAPVISYMYSNMEVLLQTVQAALNRQVAGAQGAGAPAAAVTADDQGVAGRPHHAPREGEQERDPLRDYNQPGRGAGAGYGPPYQPDPLSVGGGDLMPGGVPMPGRPLGGGFPRPGGGMHMGPGHPAFGGGGGMFPDPGMAPRPGFGGQGQGGPGPGMRWDPIAPPGLPGFRPDDFRPGGPGRGGQGIDPDIMQPGAGRGTDWDQMYG